MADGTQFSLEQARDLAAEVYNIPNGESRTLLYQQNLGVPIHSVETIAASRAGVNGGFDKLYLATSLEMDDDRLDVDSVAHDVRDLLLESETLTLGRLRPQAGLGLIAFHDFKMKDVGGYLAAAWGGETWSVSSVLDTFRYDYEEDLIGVEIALGQHAFVVTSLVKVLSRMSEERDANGRSHVFQLTMPMELGRAETDEMVELEGDSFNDFVGIDSIVQDLRDMVRLANMPPERRRDIELTQAVLLHGPSGVAKTALMHALGDELHATTRVVNFDELGTRWTGEWASSLSRVFEDAYECPDRVLIILDEMDGLVVTGNEGSTGNITAVLKSQLEKLQDYPHVFVAAATNNVDTIDPVIRASKRFPLTLPIELPNPDQRAEIFRRRLVGQRLDGLDLNSSLDEQEFVRVMAEGDGLDFAELAAETDSFSGGDICAIISEVAKRNLLDCPDDETAPKPPNQDALLKAITRAKKTKS